MYIPKTEINRLISLRSSHGLVDKNIADRQLNVVYKAVNHFLQGNDVIYIADEVGLGKTYIALGIISVLRHLSPDYNSFNDVIIVPKANLQYKWEKEIKNFIQDNYRQSCNRVRSLLGTPVAALNSMDTFLPVTSNSAYSLYRMSSFSYAINYNNPRQWFKEQLAKFTCADSRNIFEKAKKLGYFRQIKNNAEKKVSRIWNVCWDLLAMLMIKTNS